MKHLLALVLSLNIFVSSAQAADTQDPGEAEFNKAYEAVRTANYGTAIQLYDGLMKQARPNSPTACVVLTSRGLAKALAGQMTGAESDLLAAAKCAPCPLEDMKTKLSGNYTTFVQIYQWLYLTHLYLNKWQDAIADIGALEKLDAMSSVPGAQADRGRLHLLLGQDKLGLSELKNAAAVEPRFKPDYETAEKALADPSSKASYLGSVTSQLKGTVNELKQDFQEGLTKRKHPGER